jgi:hypothetical protein
MKRDSGKPAGLKCTDMISSGTVVGVPDSTSPG